MSWLEVAFELKSDQVEQGTALLENLGALAVTCYDAKDEPIFEPPPLSEPIIWEDTILVGLMEAECDFEHLKLTLLDHFPNTQVSAKNLEDKNWITYVQSKFPAQQYGKLWICPSWDNREMLDDEVLLRLDPGAAFGTGTHATTHLCLDWISSAPMQHKTVLDFGCGSGILGLACALLGAVRVYGIDHCPQAIAATQANREKNDIEAAQLSAHLPKDPVFDGLKVDYVIANILAGPLMELKDTLLSHLNSNGTLILSGLLEEQAQAIKIHYQDWVIWTAQANKDGWCMLQAIKREAYND